MNAVTDWQRRPTDFGSYVLPEPVAGAAELRVPPPRTPMRRVVALASTWCVDGRTAVVGKRYELPADIAEGLVWREKARFA